MKLSSVLILAIAATTTDGLAPSVANRRAFIAKAGATTAGAFTAAIGASSASAKSNNDYSLDTGSVVVEEKKAAKSSGGGNLVAGALGGSVLLSLPFFLPNLLRLAGVNNAKLPDDAKTNTKKKKGPMNDAISEGEHALHRNELSVRAS
eukprot:CAMPEP_0113312266 /NCGR_PEP_ID=MMETSP0010_2-20120614/9160_1 /TAXON_ID=216773 ORGANISM="Corethron hystrix, Strain 308" /NCGR_SAMPLE_ID=MMETSP0010_2 /ASSEMBLY_ACC=CAM_ASM_000155 /LENGTH=148 /DNA_ID=CAMNT_0000168047 /DNA_START=31 /DNA_END=477 /DNA_ORIENTATION=+ /assembly_acc=CAM_ASM_000155